MNDTRKIKLHRNSSEFKQLKNIVNDNAGAVQRNLLKDITELKQLNTDLETIEKWTKKGWNIEARKRQLQENISCYRYELWILEIISFETIGEKYKKVKGC